MAQTAALYLLEIQHLELLDRQADAAEKKKPLLGWPKKNEDYFTKALESSAVEKFGYRWSGLAFTVLAVFSRERLDTNWDNLEYSSIANNFSEKWKAGIYIFSIKDENLAKLKLDGVHYSLEEINEFAIEFAGDKPRNPEIMKEAVELLNKALSKMSGSKVVLLQIK